MNGDTTPGLVCAHHHLYSALARGLPGPTVPPTTFRDILESIWWRLDVALDLDTLAASARLGALEALESGCTALIDHHESPNAIEGSLDVIADACAEVGVRVSCAYGVTDRHGADQAKAGLDENERYLRGLDPADGGVWSGSTPPSPAPTTPWPPRPGWPPTSGPGCTSTWPRVPTTRPPPPAWPG